MSGGRREDPLRVDFKHRGADQLVRQRAVVTIPIVFALVGQKRLQVARGSRSH